MDDRMFGMLTQIVRALLHEPEKQGAEEEIVNLLLQEGYRMEEIVDAFKWLERFSNFMVLTEDESASSPQEKMVPESVTVPLDEESNSIAEGSHRILHRREERKFTEEGECLFFNWLQSGLLSSEERESILHRILQEKDHSIGRDELVAIARKEAGSRSALALFLMENSGGSVGPH